MAAVVPILDESAAPAFNSSKWWLLELSKRLARKRPVVAEYEAYYNGDHKLEYATEKFRKAFGNLFKELADNWCEVIVDATEERLNVEGFRFGDDPEADSDAWEIWQRNNLDADSQLAHLDMLVAGSGYALVWAKGDENPVITVEPPTQCIVAHAAGSRRERAAGLKQWRGDDGYLYSVVYLADNVTRFRSASKPSNIGNSIDDGTVIGEAGELENPAFWVPHEGDGDPAELHNPMGRVSLVPLYNRPRTLRSNGVSELRTAKPMQNAVNKLLSDLMLASEYGAFRQRWATGLTLDRDEEGNTKPPPFKHGPGNIWTDEGSEMPGAESARFGEFEATDLKNIVVGIDLVVAHLASQSRTPPHYLNTSADRLSGESIKSSETGLVAKCKRKMRPTGEGWEEVERCAFAVKGDKRKDEYAAETIWADPESRTEAEHVDATLKKKDLGVPLAQLWEDLGYTPKQIARFEAMRAQEELRAALNPPPAPVVVNTAPVDTAGSPGQRPPAPGGDEGGAPPAPAK